MPRKSRGRSSCNENERRKKGDMPSSFAPIVFIRVTLAAIVCWLKYTLKMLNLLLSPGAGVAVMISLFHGEEYFIS